MCIVFEADNTGVLIIEMIFFFHDVSLAKGSYCGNH